MVNVNSTVEVAVAGGGGVVAGHGGLHVLGRFADGLGVGGCLSAALSAPGERGRVHDRGKVLVQAMLMLAGGGEACSDIEVLRAEGELFGSVASDSTLYRVLRGVDEAALAGLRGSFAVLRRRAWALCGAEEGEVVIDIDASLHEVHSENKAGTGPHYKGGFGFHPMYAFADRTGECLSVMLRPGNAAANSIDDHTAVLDAAIEALPTDAAAGHRLGDDASSARRRVRVRTDSAGCTAFVDACADRNVAFSVVARTRADIDAAIAATSGDSARWRPAQEQPGAKRRRRARRGRGAQVADLTDLVDVSAWPNGTRLIVRREPRHQGAQRSLFASDDWRYWGHWTNLAGSAAARDADMRAHARVEDNIARLKDSGAQRFPFSDLDANRAWLQLAAFADALVRWFQTTCLTGRLARARPKTLRWGLWHTPGRVTRHARQTTLRLPNNTAATAAIITAHLRINLLI